jgi:hypothetical protein
MKGGRIEVDHASDIPILYRWVKRVGERRGVRDKFGNFVRALLSTTVERGKMPVVTSIVGIEVDFGQ